MRQMMKAATQQQQQQQRLCTAALTQVQDCDSLSLSLSLLPLSLSRMQHVNLTRPLTTNNDDDDDSLFPSNCSLTGRRQTRCLIFGLSARISQKLQGRIARISCCLRLWLGPLLVALLCYIFPVLWITHAIR